MWTYEAHLEQTSAPKRYNAIKLPSSYRAPTWSWAAVDGSVKFERLSKDHISAQYCDASVKTLSVDEFGIVESGWLEIEVRISRWY